MLRERTIEYITREEIRPDGRELGHAERYNADGSLTEYRLDGARHVFVRSFFRDEVQRRKTDELDLADGTHEWQLSTDYRLLLVIDWKTHNASLVPTDKRPQCNLDDMFAQKDDTEGRQEGERVENDMLQHYPLDRVIRSHEGSI